MQVLFENHPFGRADPEPPLRSDAGAGESLFLACDHLTEEFFGPEFYLRLFDDGPAPAAPEEHKSGAAQDPGPLLREDIGPVGGNDPFA